MSSILENVSRAGNFTSSVIHKLVKGAPGFSAPGLTYINEKNIERKMGVCLKQDVYSKPMAWGDLMEMWVHEKKLGLDYESVGKVTLDHPAIKFWKGSPDFRCVSERIAAECKGYERKNYSIYADAIRQSSTEVLKKECPEEYWQLISNAIILGYKKIQPIVYMPYLSDLPAIAEFIDNYDGIDQWKYKYIHDAISNGTHETDLPYLVDDGYYKDFTTCILEAPQEDMDYLTERVQAAGKLLVPFFVK